MPPRRDPGGHLPRTLRDTVHRFGLEGAVRAILRGRDPVGRGDPVLS